MIRFIASTPERASPLRMVKNETEPHSLTDRRRESAGGFLASVGWQALARYAMRAGPSLAML